MRQSIKAIAAIAITSGLLADTDPCFTKAFTHLYPLGLSQAPTINYQVIASGWGPQLRMHTSSLAGWSCYGQIEKCVGGKTNNTGLVELPFDGTGYGVASSLTYKEVCNTRNWAKVTLRVYKGPALVYVGSARVDGN